MEEPSREDELQVSEEAHGDAVVLRVRGEVDIATAPTLRAAGEGALAAGASRVVVDLSGVPFLDSSGLSALLALHRDATGRGGTVVLAAPTPPVAEVFGVVALASYVPVMRTVDEALADSDRDGVTSP